MTSQFWLEHPIQLATQLTILPEPTASLEEQLNSITRGVLLLWFVLYGLEYDYHSVVLLVSLLFIIILYYIQRNMRKECFTEIPLQDWTKLPKGNKLKIENPTKYRFCQDGRPIVPNQTFHSTNQALVGPPNPKTQEPTYVIPPAAAWDYWSEDYIVPSGVNDSTFEELFQSGYVGDSQCLQNEYLLNLNTPYSQAYRMEHPIPPCPQKSLHKKDVMEGYSGMYPSNYTPTPHQPHTQIQPPTPGDMIDFTYNPEQLLEHNIPSNMPVGQCTQQNVFNDYNANINTQIIQPGVYQRNEIIEPIQSNMGITFTQQFEPVSVEKNQYGTTIVSHDPRITPNVEPPTPREPTPAAHNVYDPRLSGYGTSYRSYVDPLTGRPRFYYDDVNAIRQPNYITRNNVDDAPWAPQYGQIQGIMGSNRELAQNKFLTDTLKQRTELQDRLMHKYNTQVGWQRRIAPLRRDQGGGALLK